MRCYHLDRNEAVGRNPELDEMNVGVFGTVSQQVGTPQCDIFPSLEEDRSTICLRCLIYVHIYPMTVLSTFKWLLKEFGIMSYLSLK